MSLTYNQILSRIERTCGYNAGDIVNNPARKSYFTDAINVAQDEVFSIIFNRINKGWQFDDIYHEKYPIITFDIVSGQRDYSFITDEQGNLILDIYKVVMIDSQNVPHELTAVDQNEINSNRINLDSFSESSTGTPKRYDIMANGIFLDPIPNFSKGDALKIYINREGMRFQTSDTTKKAGFSGLYHEYLVLKPSYDEARDKSLKNAEKLKRDLLEMRTDIETHYGNKGKDYQKTLVPNYENNK